MGDGYLNRFLSRSLSLFRMVAVLVFVFSAETNNLQSLELSDPKSEDSPDCHCYFSRVILIRLYCDGCPWIMFVSGGFFHRWYLRLLTDALSPLHLFGDIIWVYDPGINRNGSLKGMGLNNTRIGVMQGRSTISNRQRCACHYKGVGDVCMFCYVTVDDGMTMSVYLVRIDIKGVCRSTQEDCVDRHMSEAVANSAIDDLFFSVWLLTDEAIRKRTTRPNHQHEGVRRRHNTSRRISFLFQREADVITMTSKSRQQFKVMLKAFWSLSYMPLAINIKYMKGDLSDIV